VHRFSQKATALVRAVALALVRVVARAAGSRPVPVWLLVCLRRIVPAEDALLPTRKERTGRASTLRNPFLASELGSLELGDWSLSPSTIDFIEAVVREGRPRLILEFGSGVSTACFARFMQESYPDARRVLVLAIEEDAEQARATRARLAALGLADLASVVVAPIGNLRVGDREVRCYQLPSLRQLREMVDSTKAELVVVDGPTLGSGGTRDATLVVANELIAEGAVVLLDDARRDAELRVAKVWRRLPGVEIGGVHLVGKGLLEARLHRPGPGAVRDGGRGGADPLEPDPRRPRRRRDGARGG
jgi:hypothetical protein